MISAVGQEHVVRALPSTAPPPTGVWSPTRASALIAARPREVMRVIADTDSYPEWMAGVQHANILATWRSGRPQRVRLVVGRGELLDEQIYTYWWHSERSVSWMLVSSTSLRSLTGRFLLSPVDSRSTVVTYELSLETKTRLVGPLRRRAELVFINRTLPGLKHRIEQQTQVPAARRPSE